MEKKKKIVFYLEILALILYIVAHVLDNNIHLTIAAALIMMFCGGMILSLWKHISWYQRVCNISIILICLAIIAIALNII